MDYNKILKFVVLIIVILFFSYINSRKAVEEKSSNKEGFTSASDIREYFNKKKRNVRHKVEEFKTKTSNTVDKIYKKLNN
mgnify:CR=1 FL=1